MYRHSELGRGIEVRRTTRRFQRVDGPSQRVTVATRRLTNDMAVHVLQMSAVRRPEIETLREALVDELKDPHNAEKHEDEEDDMTNKPQPPVDLEDGDDALPVTRETSRGGQEPPPDVNDRPDQNVGYDEAVKGAPLTAEEKQRAERESPLAADTRGAGDVDGNRGAGNPKARGPAEP